MRILHVIASTAPSGGGPIEVIRQLRVALRTKGVEAEVASCDAPDAPWLQSSGLVVHALGPGLLRYQYSPKLLPWLREHAREYDAVVVNGIWRYSAFAAWRALAHSGVPYFVFTHGMLDPWFKRRYPLKHLKKCVYWPWADYRVLRDAQAVVFTSEEERRVAPQSFRLYRANGTVINYGTSRPPSSDPEVFYAAWPELRGRKIILFLSRIHEKKGCDILLNSLAQLAGTNSALHLVIAGTGDPRLTAALTAQARVLGVERQVTWTGMLQGEMKWSAFHAAELFCLPSHQENFGIAVAEALGCGLPVLVSDKVNIWREVAEDGAAFVDEDTVAGTLRSLRRWLGMPEDEYAEMRTRARMCFESRFNIERTAQQLVEMVAGCAT